MISVLKKSLRLCRAFAAILAVAIGAGAPLSAFAQDSREGIVARQQKSETEQAEKAQEQTQQNPITQPLALSPDVSSQRVGVDENNKQLLTLQDVITLALQNNLDIEQFRQSVQIAQYNLFALYGYYDVTSGTETGFRNSITPSANIFSGAGSSGAFSNKTLYYNFTTSQQIQRTGGNYLIEFDNSRTKTSSIASTLNPQYSNTLTFTFTQPLMRNFSIDANRRAIKIGKKSLDLSDSQFRQTVINIINSVQRAYWDLVYAIDAEKIARDNVRLARQQLENNQKMVEAGTLAPIELRSTEAQLEQNKGNVIVALQGITTAENALKGLVLKDPKDNMWNAVLVPTDKPDLTQVTFNLQEASALALKNRPELDQLRLQSEQKDIDIKFYRNQMKPQLNFIGIYTNSGLAGSPTPQLDNDGNPILDDNGNPVLKRVNPQFIGGYGQSLKNLFGQDFRTYQVGVSISFPWRNRAAEANYGRTLAEAKQLDARQRQMVQDVQIEVRNALQAVEAARMRFEAARAGVIAADAQYKGEQERFRAGLSQNFLVLQRQTDFAVARGNELRALTDYNKAIADLQRVTGMTLVSNNVQVQALPEKDNK
ncbi:MAG: TolC family protein [Acidobacteriota bacterium]